MEIPEKIYLVSDEKDAFVFTQKRSDNRGVEYIRTDTFIEKACDVYCRLCDTKECGDTGECCWVEKFRKLLMK